MFTLREADDKETVNHEESQQISFDHGVYHHHEWTDYTKTSAIKIN